MYTISSNFIFFAAGIRIVLVLQAATGNYLCYRFGIKDRFSIFIFSRKNAFVDFILPGID